MIQVLASIREAANEFEKRPYFRLLEGAGTAGDVATLVSGATFFVFAFQDMLRLNHERVQDTALRKIAQQHRREDAGHEIWFLNDMRKLGVQRDIAWLFSNAHRATRDASLQLIAEVLRTDDDRQRIVIPLVLEAGGGVFFSRVFRFFDRCGIKEDLEYFAESHWQVEKGHEMFEEAQAESVRSIVLDDVTRQLSIEMTHRMFAALTLMVDDICAQIEAQRRRSIAV